MIPEFITANPAKNRSISETPPATESASTGQLPGNGGFQQALQKQTTERAPQDRKLPDGDPPATAPLSGAQPESTKQVAGSHRAATEPEGVAESSPAPQPSDESQPTSQNPIARSDARDDSASVTRTEPANSSQNSQSESDRSSQQILRIDQGTSTAAELRPGTEQKSPTTNPTVNSTEVSNPGTLPSLVRWPLDQVFVTENLPSLHPAPAAELSAGIDLVVRPFLNDARLPDDLHTIGQDFRVTSTEPSLNQNSAAVAESLSPNVLIELHDLLPFPTLPSLRPDVEPPGQVASNVDAAVVQLFNEVASENTAGSELSTAEVNGVGTAQPFDIQPNGHVIVETTLPLTLERFSPTETSSPETAPLVLPSLSTEVNRATLTGTSEPTQQIDPAQTSTPDSLPRVITAPQISNNTVDAGPDQNAAAGSSRQPAVVPQQNSSAVVVSEQSAVREQIAGAAPVEADSHEQRQTTVESASNAFATTISSTIEDPPAVGPVQDVSEQPSRESRQQNDSSAAGHTAAIPTASADTVSSGAINPVTPVATSSAESLDGEIANEDVARRPANRAASTVQDSATSVRIETVPPPTDNRQSTAREAASVSDLRSEPERVQASIVPDRTAGTSLGHVSVSTNNSANQETPVEHRVDTNTPATRRTTVPLSGSTSSDTATSERHDDGSPVPPAAGNQTGNAAAQSARPVFPASTQPGSSPELPGPDSMNSSSAVSAPPVVESSSTTASPATVDTQTTNVGTSAPVAGQSVSAPVVTPGTVSPASPVREPAVPMEIQGAVSAIQEATSGDGHIRVRLNPRELGTMLVEVSRVDGGIVARLEVESPAARVAVLESLPDLQQSLSRSGATVDRIEVVLTETRSESGRQDSDQSQQRDQQQSRQDRQSSEQRQARDEQNQRRQQRDERASATHEEPSQDERPEQLDIKL
jgi:flagellar hook-length control protein FliK